MPPTVRCRAEYASEVVPGILLMSIASGVTGTATSVAMDMAEGIIARRGPRVTQRLLSTVSYSMEVAAAGSNACPSTPSV